MIVRYRWYAAHTGRHDVDIQKDFNSFPPQARDGLQRCFTDGFEKARLGIELLGPDCGECWDLSLLAEKLSQCLDGQGMKSDVALNFGLYGCFYQQLKSLPTEDKQEKMKIVTQSISSLSREERQKSFSRCVTDQSISYLK